MHSMNVLDRIRRTILRQDPTPEFPKLKIVMRGPSRYVLRNFSGDTITGLTAVGAAGIDLPDGLTMPNGHGHEFYLFRVDRTIRFEWDGGKERVPVPLELPD